MIRQSVMPPTIKVLVHGSTGSGASNLSLRYATGQFNEKLMPQHSNASTIGVDFRIKFDLSLGVRLQIF